MERPHEHGTRHQNEVSQLRDEQRVTKSEIIGSLRGRIQEVVNIIESLDLDLLRSKATQFENVILDFKQTLPMLPMRVSTTRARLPAAQSQMKRRGRPGKLNIQKKAKEASLPQRKQKSGAVARGDGSSKQPITFTSSGTTDQSDDASDNGSAVSSTSDVCEYGFRYVSDDNDQYGFSDSGNASSDNSY